MNNRPSIRHAWRARTQREQWLLTGALVASLLVGSYGFANTPLTEWLERLSPQSGASPAQVNRLPQVLPAEADVWRRAALEQGLVLNSVEVQNSSVVTQGEARSPEAFVAFSRWAAQQGWWALDWTLTQEAEASLVLEARWMSQLENSPFARRTP